MNRTVIVGASAGGLTAAEALRRAGHEGVIPLVGDKAEASATAWETAALAGPGAAA
ncbi:hypothetical protein ACF073_22410 [Streptomyces sp. NPDC015171]|uniref:hypothetical protein n=1 Tax=Streptomyces sp. NPDC015171 TaxID=3364945 RepID=UPI0036F5B277